MPKVVDAARVTSKDNTIWRTCPACEQLLPLPPDALFCDTCAHRTPPDREGSWTR